MRLVDGSVRTDPVLIGRTELGVGDNSAVGGGSVCVNPFAAGIQINLISGSACHLVPAELKSRSSGRGCLSSADGGKIGSCGSG